MKKIMTTLLAAVVLISVLSCASTAPKSAVPKNEKPAILIAAFGSSYESGLKNYEDLDKAYAAAFPGHDIYWAFTASFIVKKLRKQGQTTVFERGVEFYTMDEAMDMFRNKGIENVAVQSMMVMVGSEYREIINTNTKGLNVKYAHSLFFNPEDIQNTANALAGNFGDSDTFTILAAHGNDKHPEYNAELIQMDDYLRENYDKVRVATVEGAPLFNNALVEEVKASGASKVRFVPLMLTVGDHFKNDIMGDEEDSWKTILAMDASGTDGMASNPAVQEIYINNFKRVLAQF